MARKLNQYVTASNPETGESGTFGPDDEVPEWAEKQITAEGVWEGDDASAVAEREPGDPGNSGVSDPSAFDEQSPATVDAEVESAPARSRKPKED